VKCEVIIDPNSEEKVVIYAKEESELVKNIKILAEQNTKTLHGYTNNEIVNLNPYDIHCFCIIDNKVFALCEKQRYLLKERLYSLEDKLPKNFIKINQSCLANIEKIEKFDTSITGTLKIYFKNGHIDYVSRRQLKFIKERLGI